MLCPLCKIEMATLAREEEQDGQPVTVLEYSCRNKHCDNYETVVETTPQDAGNGELASL